MIPNFLRWPSMILVVYRYRLSFTANKPFLSPWQLSNNGKSGKIASDIKKNLPLLIFIQAYRMDKENKQWIWAKLDNG